jgi:hypothetical protein
MIVLREERDQMALFSALSPFDQESLNLVVRHSSFFSSGHAGQKFRPKVSVAHFFFFFSSPLFWRSFAFFVVFVCAE